MEEKKEDIKPTKKKRSKAGRIILILIGIMVVFVLVAIALYQVPAIQKKFYPYVTIYRSKIVYFFKPPAKSVFEPSTNSTMDASVIANLTAMAPTATAIPEPTQTPNPTESTEQATPVVEESPTPLPTDIPPRVVLEGIVQEYQNFNSCGPANLKLAMSYWGWKGGFEDIERIIKPGWRDRNVSITEMLYYVQEHTDYDAVLRYGGEVDLARQLIAAGFPVLVERGYTHEVDWMGHYGVLDAYDDESQTFHIPDTNHGNLRIKYEQLQEGWDQFAGAYLVIFNPEDKDTVLHILGEQADPDFNYNYTLNKYQAKLEVAEAHEKYFVLFNLGELLNMKKQYVEAATMFDEAFKNYGWLPVEARPWRMIWYQFGPYESYYYTGRYEDVVSLAYKAVTDADEPALPETFLWSGRANVKLGNTGTAIFEFRRALQWHPRWEPAIAELEALGEKP